MLNLILSPEPCYESHKNFTARHELQQIYVQLHNSIKLIILQLCIYQGTLFSRLGKPWLNQADLMTYGNH